MTSSKPLHDWGELKAARWGSLLLGNGVSINICSGFRYDRLFDHAKLSAASSTLFGAFQTTNFELVLERLHYAQQTTRALGFPKAAQTRIGREYDAVREALFEAVAATHIRHAELPSPTLQAVAEALLSYGKIYTTNYDLLPYWSLVACGSKVSMDFFLRRGGPNLIFDPATARWWRDRARIYYLHGGLHLWRDDWTGVTGKWEGLETSGGLLELEKRYETFPGRLPLLVSEGTAEHKSAAISRSGYLSFALQELARDTSNLVVLGSSFGQSDAHIVEAIGQGRRRKVAISLRVAGLSPKAIKLRMAEVEALFEKTVGEVLFFDPATHPLGDSALTVR